jgi:hypothetical protein
MKRILILFTASLLFLACSNDNDTVQQAQDIELKIKKFTITAVHTDNWRLEYSFDEDAKPIRYFSTLDGIDGVKMDVSYNDSGHLTGVVGVQIIEGQTQPWQHTEYVYNTSNEIEQINRFDEYGSDYGSLAANHFQDSIQVQRRFGLDGDSDYTLIFGANNLLIQENIEPNAWNPNPTVTKYTYSDENLINILKESDGNTMLDTNFEHDDKINPLHPVLTRDYKSFILDNIGLYLAFNRTYSYSKNNITSYNEFGNLRIITYQYNDLGYPVSAEVTSDGELFELFNYEYY